MTGIEQLLQEPLAQAIGWALLHFVWQGALVGALAAAALAALRRSDADVRYTVASIALTVMGTLPIVTAVQTCRGSHTHTVVTQPGDNDNVYIYVSGTSGVRDAKELAGCQDGGIDDPNTARFRLEVIKVPLA